MRTQNRYGALRRTSFGIAVGIGVLAGSAQADVQFTGFGQMVVGSTLGNKLIGSDPNNPATYVPFPDEDSYSADPSFAPESLFALQARTALSGRLSATAQIVATGADQQDFTPSFTWAYATFQANDNWSIKAGRQRIPFYLYSDFLQVGTAYPWIRPPLSVYGAPITNYDGISALGSYQVGDWWLQPQAYYGAFDGGLSYHGVEVDSHLHNIAGAVLDASYNEWLELRLSYAHSENTSTSAQLNGGVVYAEQTVQLPDGTDVSLEGAAPGSGLIPTIQLIGGSLGQLAPVLEAVDGKNGPKRAEAAVRVANRIDAAADQINLNDDPSTVVEGGFEVDRNNVLLTGEYIYSDTPNSFFVRASSYYASLGYHFGMLMPILLYGHTDDRPSSPDTPDMIPSSFFTPAEISKVEAANVPGLGVTTAGEMAAVNDGLSAVHKGAIEALAPIEVRYNFYEFGLRYDLSSNTALKADYTFFRSGLDGVADARLLSGAFVFSF